MAKYPHFNLIYKKFSKPLYKFIAKRMGANQKVVEEVLEDTMVAAWKGFETFKNKSSYFTWLCRISLNKIADYYRDQINTRSKFVTPSLKALANMEDKTISPEEKMVIDELRSRVNDCLDLLSVEKRRLLQFRYWYDLSYKQIAKMMGASERSVEGKIYRAKNEFAQIWNEKSS